MTAKDIFVDREIIPDLIDSISSSNVKLEIKYEFPREFYVHEHRIHSLKDVSMKPTVQLLNAQPNELYTLAMLDPDAPSVKNPAFREWRHWLVVNISGGDLSKADEISKYQAPEPDQDTGIHRYVFLLFKQLTRLEIPPMKDVGNGRANFKIREFMSTYKLGNPICAKFFDATEDRKVLRVSQDMERITCGDPSPNDVLEPV